MNAQVTTSDNLKTQRPADFCLYEYCTIRYVPHIERGEFINVGLLMMNKRRKWLRAQIHIDRERLLALDPNARVGELRHQLSLFERRDVPERHLPVEETYRWLCAPKNAVLQTSPSHPGLSTGDDMDKEFDRLFKSLVL